MTNKCKDKKILHVVNIFFVLPFFIGNQFKYFKDKGYSMHVACSKSEHISEYAQQQGFDYIETPINRSISIVQDVKSVVNLCKYIKHNKINIVVGHTPKGGLLAMLSSWFCRVPNRIYFRHGIVYETSHGLKRFVLKNVDRIASLCSTKVVCVSPSVLRRSLEDKLSSRNKMRILGKGTCNGVDTILQFNPKLVDKRKIEELRIKYGIKNNDFVIGYSGRLVRDKGIIELVRAFDLLENAGNCKLLLVGMFEERDALPEDVKDRIKKDERIVFTGFINGGMELYYSLMSVYVLPSYREGFPTGVLEAQAMGKPVITTRVTGCCDSIIDGVTGLFVNNEASDLVEKLNMIRKYNKIDGNKGREWVKENFDSHLVWKHIEKLY